MEWKIYSEKSIFITGTKDELEKIYKFISAMADSSNEQGNCIKPDVSVSLPDPALKLAGKMAIAAETVINSKITTVSVAIAMLEDALNNYNNEIFSRQ